MVDASSAAESRLGSLLMGILFSLTTIAALLFFIGRARIQSMEVALGIPAGFLRSSPTDYVSAGADVALQFVVLAAMPVLLAAMVHRSVVTTMLAKPSYHRARRIIRRVLIGATALGVLGLGLVAYGLVDQEDVGRPLGLALPVTLAASGAILAYRLYVFSQARGASGKLVTIVLTCLSVIGILWAGALYGVSVGRQFAQHFADNFTGQADVMIFSQTQLQLGGRGVTFESYDDAGGYRYCYRGLRYLMETDGYLVLAPVGWTPGVDPLLLISTKTPIRVDSVHAPHDMSKPLKCSDR